MQGPKRLPVRAVSNALDLGDPEMLMSPPSLMSFPDLDVEATRLEDDDRSGRAEGVVFIYACQIGKR